MIYDSYHVLILVLVDFTLWQDSEELVNTMFIKVLILVLVDFTLWLMAHIQQSIVIGTVLILVLVDFTLWRMAQISVGISMAASLNPCFSGLYSLTKLTRQWKSLTGYSLNPCFSGLYSLTGEGDVMNKIKFIQVLILVLVDFTLWHFSGVGHLCRYYHGS